MSMDMILEQNKIFPYFEQLPREMSSMIVGEMAGIDRCRFSGCSRMSNAEAKADKNYVAGLEINGFQAHFIEIKVIHGYEQLDRHGYSLEFHEKDGKKYMECRGMYAEKLWLDDLEPSTNLVNHACKYFKNLLKMHQNSIKKLWIYANVFEKDFDFGIRRLKNLKELGIEARFLEQFLPKLRHPLEDLRLYGKMYSECLESDKAMYQVTHRLYAPYAKFNMEQTLQLAAKYVCLDIGKLTEKVITIFVRSWMYGSTTHFQQLSWNLINSTFNTRILIEYLGLLGARKHENGWAELMHDTDATKKLLIFAQNNSLTLEWRENDTIEDKSINILYS